ncbi:MAG: hypothetical protein H6698_07120 [Myxococcales bacterium]|nr:hypothetical protein [Myxococcales bacterium]MCB9521527.1 hypothetical protein [Myxococcales bacterium]MCB9534078.1 hypothetical protein [Myxococcales bacterium]
MTAHTRRSPLAGLLTALLAVLSGCRLETGAPSTDGDVGASDARESADGDASDGASIADGVDGDGRSGDGGPDTPGAPETGADVSRCLVVATTEFRTDGGVTVIDADSFRAATDVTAVAADALVAVVDQRVFVINRQGGDSLQELDPDQDYATVSQESVGRGSGPWGVIPLGDGTAWVPLYNDGALQRVDLRPGATALRIGDPVALPTDYDADRKAEPAGGLVHDGVLYVILQGLGDYPLCTPDSRGRLLAMDPQTLAPVPAFEGHSVLTLAACNPTTWLRAGDELLIGHTGNYRVVVEASTDDGGIEVVDLAAGASRGLIVTEADFGGRDLMQIASDGGDGRGAGESVANPVDHVWITIAGEDFGAEVRRLDLDPVELGRPVWESGVGGIFDLDVAFGRVWIVDRTTSSPGVVVLDAESGERIAGPIDTGFAPFSLAPLEREGCDAVVNRRR